MGIGQVPLSTWKPDIVDSHMGRNSLTHTHMGDTDNQKRHAQVSGSLTDGNCQRGRLELYFYFESKITGI